MAVVDSITHTKIKSNMFISIPKYTGTVDPIHFIFLFPLFFLPVVYILFGHVVMAPQCASYVQYLPVLKE